MIVFIAKNFLKLYVAQAVAGGAVGFIIPWLKLFGAF